MGYERCERRMRGEMEMGKLGRGPTIDERSNRSPMSGPECGNRGDGGEEPPRILRSASAEIIGEAPGVPFKKGWGAGGRA